MTEPIFKAPLPPQGVEFNPPPQKEEEEQPKKPIEDIKQKIIQYLWYVLGGTFFIGLIFGLMMGGGETTQSAPRCLLRQVPNPDIQDQERSRLPLCGRTTRTAECVLYIMNSSRQTMLAGDFFDMAANLTERPKQMISTDNPMYSQLPIAPGNFAEIRIPPRN